MEEALTVKEVCQRFKLSDRTVRDKIKSGYLPAKRIGTGPRSQYRIPLEACRKAFFPDMD